MNKSFYGYFVPNGEDAETLAVVVDPDGRILPLFSIGEDNLEEIKKAAQLAADSFGRTLVLKRFDEEVLLDSVVPRTVN